MLPCFNEKLIRNIEPYTLKNCKAKTYYVSEAPPTAASTPPTSKIFFVFSVFTLRNCLYITNC